MSIVKFLKHQIKENIRAMGSDHPLFFDNVGGVHLQQDLNDVTELIYFLFGGNYDSYLEIGAAAGGMVAVMNYFLSFNIIYTIDTNDHPKSNLRKPLLDDLFCEYIDIVGNSRDPKVVEKLKNDKCKFDIILIDGDHSYDGVKQDVKNYRTFLKSGGYMIFHDALYHNGVIRTIEELKNDTAFTFIAIFGERFGNAVFRKH